MIMYRARVNRVRKELASCYCLATVVILALRLIPRAGFKAMCREQAAKIATGDLVHLDATLIANVSRNSIAEAHVDEVLAEWDSRSAQLPIRRKNMLRLSS